MARPLFFVVLSTGVVAATLVFAAAQRPLPHDVPEDDKAAAKMKRSQIEELLKSDRVKSIEDATEMMKLSEALRDELEKNDKSILSVTALKKAEEIEKLAKRIRGRMRRF